MGGRGRVAPMPRAVPGLQLLGNLLLLLALAAAVAAGCAAALRYGRPLAVDLLPVFLTPAPSA